MHDHLKTHPADKHFLVGLMAYINKDHRIFDRNYMGERRDKLENQQIMIDAPWNCFEGLGQLSPRSLRKRNTAGAHLYEQPSKVQKL